MPSIQENLRFWQDQYGWHDQGEEWSSGWGSSAHQWARTVLLRIAAFVPTGSILEIAPGHGRWARFLLALCDSYVGVDMATNCVESCRRRFAGATHARFVQNDGLSLSAVAAASVDFAFSFDSLVHCEADVIDAYVAGLARTLRVGGAAFLHHSNIGAFVVGGALTVPNDHWRSISMSAARMQQACAVAGLTCVVQETLCWGGEVANDAFSLLMRLDPADPLRLTPTVVRHNDAFSDEMASARRLHELYASPKAVAAP